MEWKSSFIGASVKWSVTCINKTKYLDLDLIHVPREVRNDDLVSGLRGRVGRSNHFCSSGVLSSGAYGCVGRITQHLGFSRGTTTESALVLRTGGNNLNAC